MSANSPAELHPLFCEAFNRGDVEALLALYQPDAILMINGAPVAGRDDIREALRAMLVRQGRMTLETISVIESPLGLAVLHGRWTVEPAAGSAPGPITRGLSTEVVRKQPDGAWLFVIDNPYTPEHPADIK